MAECPGHFGVIKLATPVYHYGFMTKVKKILETVCHNCGKIKALDVSLANIQCFFLSLLTTPTSVRGTATCSVPSRPKATLRRGVAIEQTQTHL